MTPNVPQGKMSWRDAVERVLQDAPGPMHYADIAEEIAKRELRGGSRW